MPATQPPDDVAFQTATWRVERIGWVCMLGLVLAALAGALGDGPLADARIEADGATIRYERIMRLGRESRFDIAAPAQRAARITLDRVVAEQLILLGAMPLHLGLAVTRDGLVLPLDGSGAGTRATLRFQPSSAGFVSGTISVNGRDHPIRLLVLP